MEFHDATVNGGLDGPVHHECIHVYFLLAGKRLSHLTSLFAGVLFPKTHFILLHLTPDLDAYAIQLRPHVGSMDYSPFDLPPFD